MFSFENLGYSRGSGWEKLWEFLDFGWESLGFGSIITTSGARLQGLSMSASASLWEVRVYHTQVLVCCFLWFFLVFDPPKQVST